jgi:AbiV family abortive infection protein
MMNRRISAIKKIPRSKANEGLGIIRSQIRDLVDASKEITESKDASLHLRFAYVLPQFAIEELGKRLMLKEEFQNNSDDVLVIEDWFNHESKFEKAWTILEQSKKIVHKGVYGKTAFSNDFDIDVEAFHRLRVQSTYVDYFEDKNRWNLELFHNEKWDKELILSLADEIKKKAQTLTLN